MTDCTDRILFSSKNRVKKIFLPKIERILTTYFEEYNGNNKKEKRYVIREDVGRRTG